MAVEFLGHKKSLLDFLLHYIGGEVETEARSVADIFCGAAAVSGAFKRVGWRVIS